MPNNAEACSASQQSSSVMHKYRNTEIQNTECPIVQRRALPRNSPLLKYRNTEIQKYRYICIYLYIYIYTEIQSTECSIVQGLALPRNSPFLKYRK